MLRRHAGGTGLIAYGWFGRIRGWTPKGSWAAVVVKVDGEQRAVLTQLKRGSAWIDLRPGTHQVEHFAHGRRLHSETIVLAAGEIMLAAFRPPNHRPVASLRSEAWCFRRIRPAGPS